MTTNKVRQILWSLFYGALIGASLMAIAVIRSPHGHADPVSDENKDKMFLYEESQVIDVMNGPLLITIAKDGCAVALVEHDTHKVADIMWPHLPTVPASTMGAVAGIAASYYCPAVLNMPDKTTTDKRHEVV